MENELPSVPISEPNVPPVNPVVGSTVVSPAGTELPPATPSSRKTILIGVGIFLVVGVGFYFLVGGGGSGLKGSFIEDNSSPLSGEAAPAAITGEAPAAKSVVESSTDEKAEEKNTEDKAATQVAVKSITAADTSVKIGGSTILTLTGKNLFSMTIAVSGTALTFTGTNIVLTIPAGAGVSYSDLSISGDGASAVVKAAIGATAVPGVYGMSYFDIGVSDKALGIIPKVLTVE